MAVNVTEKALKKIKELLETSALSSATTFLRMEVQGGGCAGLSYRLEFDPETDPKDKIFEFPLPEHKEVDPKLRVAVDPKSYLYLNGVTLDYVEQGLTGGFTFINPQAKSSCGCGTSFSA